MCGVYLQRCKPLAESRRRYSLRNNGKIVAKSSIRCFKNQGLYNHRLGIQIYARVCTLIENVACIDSCFGTTKG